MFLQNTFQKCSRLQMFFKIGALINFPILTRKYLYWSLFLRLTLKSCLCPIHQTGETKNSHELPAGRNFFFATSLSEKIYD